MKQVGKRTLQWLASALLAGALAACVRIGGGGVGGGRVAVTGLASNQLVKLVNNNANPQTISANGTTAFPASWSGNSYSIAVQSHTPAVACTVANPSGTLGGASVVVNVICGPGTISVLHSFGALPDGQLLSGGLVMDGAGNLYGTTGYGGASGAGTVFKIDQSGNETVLHSFGLSADGQHPVAGLVMDLAGNLYGTTAFGGVNQFGTVFKIDKRGQETILYSFGASPDGRQPVAGLVIDSAGNLYGTTVIGGANGIGTVFKIDKSGHETLLHSFGASPGGGNPMAGLLMDLAGNLYGTTGGISGVDTVFKIDKSGHEAVLHSFGGPTDGRHSRADLIMDSAGNLYGTTWLGGANGKGTVFRIDKNGHETVLHSFGASPNERVAPLAGLVMDSAGNLYGTTSEGGAGQLGTVFKIDQSGHETVLYSFRGTTDGRYPNGDLVMDKMGNLYGTTAIGGANGHGAVFKLD